MRVIIGLDLSLTSTGVVVLTGENSISKIENFVLTSKNRGVIRLNNYADHTLELMAKYEPDLVVIEGYAFGRPNQMAALGELGGVVKNLFYNYGQEYIIVPPTRLKKFVCGRGNAKKDEMRLEVYKRWGFEAKTDDEIDAYGLARIGRAYLDLDKDLIKAQKEVIEDLKKEELRR